MTAAVYVRKSTDQSGVSDEQKSVARQIEHARAYATKKGWTVLDEHVYVDDGISGAEFANRPGLLRLMNALKPRAPFQVLVMSEESRLSRESIETGTMLKQLLQAGVRVFYYLDDRERTLDSPLEKIMMQLTSFADELEREKARQRTYDAMQRKAKAGHVTGGRTFGYDNVEIVGPDGQRSHVERRINDAEAAVVRQIFELHGSGRGLTAIAKRLNDQAALSPRPQQGRPKAWAPATVREILHRDLYRGVIVWNKTQKRDQWGQTHQSARPEKDWMQIQAPQLRIVPDALWTAVHARLKQTRSTYLRGSGGKLYGRPPQGVESKYLLPGIGRCGVCGGSLYVKSRSHGNKRANFYGCTSFHQRGQAVCSNGIEVPMEAADKAVLSAFERFLTPALLERVLDTAEKQLKLRGGDLEAARRHLETQLRALSGEVARLTEALATGADIPTLVAAVRDREAKRLTLEGELRATEAAARLKDAGGVREALRARLTDWRQMLSRHVPQARQMLKKLLVGKVVFTPEKTGPMHEGWRFVARGTIGKLIAGSPFAISVASPTGMAASWIPVEGVSDYLRAA